MKTVLDWRWSFRLFPDAMADLRIRPCGLIHVGAHHGEEVPIYLECGFGSITLIEADPEACAVIAGGTWINDRRIGIVNRACGAPGSPARATFHRAESTAFSGLAQDHRQEESAAFPVEVLPVSEIQGTHGGNVMVIDTQGTELDVLAGANLEPLDLIVIETQTERRGAPGAYMPDLEKWATLNGWALRTRWLRSHGWADVLLTPARVRGA
jgi:FkbM family methyltransferase